MASRIYRDTAYYKEEVYRLVGSEYEVLGEFKKLQGPIEMKHNICGHEWPVNPESFLRGSRCQKCFGNVKKSTKDFCDEIFKLYGLNYSVLGEYKTAKDYIKIRHNLCGHVYEVRPDNILHGYECPKCYGTPLKTHEEFVNEVNELLGDDYKVIGTYVKNNVKIAIQHIKCGNTYDVLPRNIISKKAKCHFCKSEEIGIKLRKSHDQFVSEVHIKYGDDYTILGYYNGANKDIKVRHEKCKREYPVKPTDLLSGKQCSRCQNVERIDTEMFKKKVFEKVGNEYEVIGEYKNAKERIDLIHKKCGQIYKASPYSFIHKFERCPCESRSKGNRLISNYLDSVNLEYIAEYKDIKCCDKNPLPFDFAVFIGNELSFFIEFDGIQHQKPVKHFGGNEKFIIQQKHDKIKNEFCKSEGISLIRIKELNQINCHINEEINRLSNNYIKPN